MNDCNSSGTCCRIRRPSGYVLFSTYLGPNLADASMLEHLYLGTTNLLLKVRVLEDDPKS
jgi:hypothetical protein